MKLKAKATPVEMGSVELLKIDIKIEQRILKKASLWG